MTASGDCGAVRNALPPPCAVKRHRLEPVRTLKIELKAHEPPDADRALSRVFHPDSGRNHIAVRKHAKVLFDHNPRYVVRIREHESGAFSVT